MGKIHLRLAMSYFYRTVKLWYSLPAHVSFAPIISGALSKREESFTKAGMTGDGVCIVLYLTSGTELSLCRAHIKKE